MGTFPYTGGDYRARIPIDQRLLAKRRIEGDCWIFIGQIDKHGYGRISYQGRKQFAHNLAYRIWRGEIPKGYEPDHLCRTTACFNPKHLEVVTSAENNRRGKHTKLTHEDIALIRSLDESHVKTAARFGVHDSTICDIRKFKRWNYNGRCS